MDKRNQIFYNLLKEFKKITGESIILNTSLNVSGKPIMGSKTELLTFMDKYENSWVTGTKPVVDMIVFGNEIIRSK